MTPCPGASTRSVLTRTGALALVFGLAMAPSAYAADGDAASTVRALVGEDGGVESVSRVGEGSAAAPSKDSLPVRLSISDSAANGVTTTRYRVQNLTAKSQPVSYAAANGKTVTEDHTIALPLVGQLRVTLPPSYRDVKAPDALVVRNEDGSHELLWSMILFAPLGSNESTASFTAKGGNGDAVARLDVAPVVLGQGGPIAAASSAATSAVDRNVSVSALTLGANEGLTALSDGVAKLMDGLVQLEEGAHALSDGLGAGADGANKLAAGLRKAKAGSGALATGLQQLSDGSGKLAKGAGALDAGAGKLGAGLTKASAGSEKLVDGSQALATGAGLTADGAAKLSAGLAQISGGLAQLNDTAGLPAALAGAKQLRAGVDLLLAGLGSGTEPKTVLGGLAGLAAGLPQAQNGVNQVAGAMATSAAAGGDLDKLIGAAQGAYYKAGCAAPPAPVAAPVAGSTALCDLISNLYYGVTSVKSSSIAGANGLGQISTGLGNAIAGVGALTAGVTQVKAGLKSGSTAKPGLAEGLDSLVAGLTAATLGVGQLATGASTAATGSVALADGTKSVADGAGKLSEEGAVPLSAGLGQLADGATQLKAGTGALSGGATQLAAGAKKAAAGSTTLDAGIGTISAGQDKVAAGLPKAVDGAGKIADGLTTVVAGQRKVAQGLADVRSKATTVVADQISASSDSAKRQIAALDATVARVTSTPGAASTTYVFAQDGAAIGLTKSSSESDLGRNVGIGAGGLLLLMTGIAGGYISGRRRPTT